jgi:hypothetical protein
MAPAQRGCEDGGGGGLGGVSGPKGQGNPTCRTLDARISPRLASGSIFPSTATSPCTSAANTAGHTKLHRPVPRETVGAHRFQRDANVSEHTQSSRHRNAPATGAQHATCSLQRECDRRAAEPEGSKHRRNMNAATTNRLLPAPNLLSAKRTIESATLRMRMSTCAAPCQGASSCNMLSGMSRRAPATSAAGRHI